jgi:ring-1,2-phenylacetyl-CoA epoxidase subunit PaaC
MSSTINYTLYLADNALILGQRNAAWCGHGPVLEQDIAITNVSLDLIGQARSFYQYAAELTGNGATEDSLAYLRTEREFKNVLLVEQPNGDWAQTILRQFFFSTYQLYLYQALLTHSDTRIAAIAEKSLKEVSYHVRWSSEWVIRLGDGTAESHSRLGKALEALWCYTGELFMPAAFESGFELAGLQANWNQKVKAILEEATLAVPEKVFMHSGGKTGTHTEQLGFILAELQYMQRTYPGAEW